VLVNGENPMPDGLDDKVFWEPWGRL